MRLGLLLSLLAAPVCAADLVSADEADLTLAPAAAGPALVKTANAAAGQPALQGAKAAAPDTKDVGVDKRPEASDKDRIRPDAAAAAAREDGRPRKARSDGVKGRKGGG